MFRTGGGQYRSYDHKKLVEEYGFTPSMSKPATPGDNAMAENFFSIFKTECIYLEKPKTLEEALALPFLHQLLLLLHLMSQLFLCEVCHDVKPCWQWNSHHISGSEQYPYYTDGDENILVSQAFE